MDSENENEITLNSSRDTRFKVTYGPDDSPYFGDLSTSMGRARAKSCGYNWMEKDWGNRQMVEYKLVEVSKIPMKEYINNLRKEQKMKEIRSARYQGRRKLAQAKRDAKAGL